MSPTMHQAKDELLIAGGAVIELPWHLGLPEDYTVVRWAQPGHRPVGWTDDEMEAALGVRPPSDADGPARWMMFRSARIGVQRPLAVADLTFGEFAEASLSRRSARARRRSVRRLVEKPPQRCRSAVVVWTPGQSEVDAENWAPQLYDIVGEINAFLIALGVAGDKRLRPLALGDLTHFVPYLPATVSRNGDWTYGPAVQLVLDDPADPKTRVHDDDVLSRAGHVFNVVSTDDNFARFYELVQRAGAAAVIDRAREAVIDYATAGEVFIDEVVRLCGPRKSVDPAKLSNVLSGDFKGKLGVHLGRLIGANTDPADPDSISFLWWLNCYLQRNRIVHEGADTNEVLAEVARIGLVTLVVEVREALRRDDALLDLARLIQWGSRVG